MKRRWLLTITMGALMHGWLFVTGCGNADAKAGSQGTSSDVPNVAQKRDKALPATQRFVVLSDFANDAVLDKETGLVWEKSPQTTSAIWIVANRTCNEKNVGGRKGWRLPSLQELTSLVNPSIVPPALALPEGHPFLAIRSAVYWSATRVGEDPKGSWGVHFGLGGGATFIHWAHPGQVWCVRDGMSKDQP
ncbi:MAG TPA: DUF1566 domain-containing protein [Nitrospiraceae bacterium]|nr:DUF1566 domain-containing protein [Nitrospiraceae bacterium]